MRFLVFLAIAVTAKANVIATAPRDLCVDRLPGLGYGYCTADETCVHGGPVCHLVAASFIDVDATADFALIQGSSIARKIMSAGDVSQTDVYEMLPYSDNLVSLKMDGADIVDMLNSVVTMAHTSHETLSATYAGVYPYAAGLRFQVDMQQGEDRNPCRFL
tara:strand:+ start:1261 stop:1743 length:483 start_codon:yes stop_codon:yes gene_type:complete